MDMVSIIEKKKLGGTLSEEEIQYFVEGAARGTLPDYQLAALLMAIRLKGMSWEETVCLTRCMTFSGSVCDLSATGGPAVDKHSTGGVGDTTTLVAAPLVAACGVPVYKMSGRGLGHTGGTLDKLESIPGFQTSISEEDFLRQVREVGLAVIGQTQNLAPADKTLYALRDVTATVDSLPLIISSILSKKFAGGAQCIVLDVKTGSGALMHTLAQSLELAEGMVKIGNGMGRKTVALVTDMNQPLGTHVGNALEVKEAIDILSCRAGGDLLTVALELGAQMLVLSGAAANREKALSKLAKARESGAGLEKLRQLIIAQGGDPGVCDDVSRLPQAAVVRPLVATQSFRVSGMDTVALGEAAQQMGAGRRTKADVIDPAVGFVLHKRIGDLVQSGDEIATLYAKDEPSATLAGEKILSSLQKAAPEENVPPVQLIDALVNENGTQNF